MRTQWSEAFFHAIAPGLVPDEAQVKEEGVGLLRNVQVTSHVFQQAVGRTGDVENRPCISLQTLKIRPYTRLHLSRGVGMGSRAVGQGLWLMPLSSKQPKKLRDCGRMDGPTIGLTDRQSDVESRGKNTYTSLILTSTKKQGFIVPSRW